MPACAISISLIMPKETISRLKPGYLIFFSSSRMAWGVSIVSEQAWVLSAVSDVIIREAQAKRWVVRAEWPQPAFESGKPTKMKIGSGHDRSGMANDSPVSVIYPAYADEVVVFAAHGLAESLSVMMGAEVAALAETVSTSTEAARPYLRLERGRPRGT